MLFLPINKPAISLSDIPNFSFAYLTIYLDLTAVCNDLLIRLSASVLRTPLVVDNILPNAITALINSGFAANV